jgi:hypothetical protein
MHRSTLEAAYLLKNRTFSENIGTILVFAIFVSAHVLDETATNPDMNSTVFQGTFINTVLVALPLWGITEHFLINSTLANASASELDTMLGINKSLQSMHFIHVLVFASLISAVDPIAVRYIQILQQ